MLVLFVSSYVRYEMLQDTVSAQRREVSALQDRNQKMAATAQRHEQIIHTMSQDLRQANEKLALEEVSKRRSLIILKIIRTSGFFLQLENTRVELIPPKHI